MSGRLLLAAFGLSSLTAHAAAPQDMACLLKAYPDFFVAIRDDNHLQSRDGRVWPFDDGVHKADLEALLAQASLKDQLAQTYPAGFPVAIPARDQDPGRIRHEALFLAMYGASENAVRQHLRAVPWAPSGRSVLFTRLNGADQALERVGQKLAENPALAAYVKQPAGTLNWRVIQGTNRRSAHSFAAAIDFQLPKNLGRYWQWSGCQANSPCTYPKALLEDKSLRELVRVFEAEGFIWGGKWYHFDSVHFEYRPELVGPACGNRPD